MMNQGCGNLSSKKQGKKYFSQFIIFVLFVLLELTSISNAVYCKEQLYENPVTKVSNETKKNKVIVLDAGHGGYDPGSSAHGFYEKDITLKYVKRIGDTLEKNGYEVVYTRANDDWNWETMLEDLEQRVSISTKVDADLFISFHLNDYETDIKGIETWTSFKDDDSYRFAQTVQKYLSNLNYSENRGLKNQDDSPLYVLALNESPSVLIELGFISSIDDMNYLSQDIAQEEIANAILNSMNDYWK